MIHSFSDIFSLLRLFQTDVWEEEGYRQQSYQIQRQTMHLVRRPAARLDDFTPGLVELAEEVLEDDDDETREQKEAANKEIERKKIKFQARKASYDVRITWAYDFPESRIAFSMFYPGRRTFTKEDVQSHPISVHKGRGPK